MALMMRSHCFRGLFYEKVKNHGLFKLEGSFESFFQKYLASACEAGKNVAKAVINELKEPPFNVAFGLYCIKRENHVLQQQFCKQLSYEVLDDVFHHCAKFQQFQLFHLFGR